MSSLEEIRKRKLEELMRLQKQQNSQESNEQAQMQQQVELMEETLRAYLTKDALSRYGNLKSAHKEKALQLLVVLYQAIKKGQVPGQIDDAILKKVLEQLTPPKREFKINKV